MFFLNPSAFLAMLFFFLFPFTPTYAITTNLTIPLLISLCFVFFWGLGLRSYLICLDKSFIRYGFWFIVSMLVSLIVNDISGSNINIRHFIGIATMCLFYQVVPILMISEIKIKKVIHITYYSFLLITLFGIADFIFKNFLGISLAGEVLFFPTEYPVSYGHFAGLSRNKSIFQEPGFYAWYLNVIGLFLLASYCSLGDKKKTIIISLLYLFSLLTTFSATGLLTALALLILILITNARKPFFLFLFVFGVVMLIYFSYDYFIPIIESKILGDNSSKLERVSRWTDALSLFINNIWFGGGLGSYSLKNETGLASFPLKVLAESGVFSFLIFIWVLLYSFVNIVRSSVDLNVKGIFIASLLGGVLHWSTSTPFYFAFSWLYFVLLNSFLMEHDCSNG